MLVRDGRISAQDLERALINQQRDGGRLGSILVELGAIDAESLTVYLGLELGIPIATGATMERCKRSAVRLLTPEQASRLRCIPIMIQGQTLIVAIDDPHDMWTLDEIASITGYRVLPRVAPEVRIFYYLERFYGVARPPRWARLGDTPRGSKQIGSEQMPLPAPPLPGLPPRSSDPIRPPTPAPQLFIADDDPDDEDEQSDVRPPPKADPSPKRPLEQVNEAYEAIEIDVADLIEVLDEDEAEIAEAAPPSTTEVVIERPRPEITATQVAPICFDDALAAMSAGEQRQALADAMLGYAASIFEVATLFMVRDKMAFGWKGFGPTVDPGRIEALLIPLNVPSMFQVALHSDHLFRGRAFPATLHSYLFKVLQCPPPPCSVVIEVAIGARPVNLLYGHKPSGETITDDEMQSLAKIAAAAADGYVRLITVRKQQTAG